LNRTEFQKLTIIRIEEARVLLERGKPDGAYYLAGYAVECALKACIAKLMKRHDFPDKNFVRDCYVHEIDKLVKTARLEIARDQDTQKDPNLAKNWSIVKDWNESSRYDFWTKTEARELLDAISDPEHGVLTWIKKHW
jgi:HEPN domain-containing protein